MDRRGCGVILRFPHAPSCRDVIGTPVGIRALHAIARDEGVDEPRMPLARLLRPEPDALQCGGPQVAEKDIRAATS